MDKQVIRDRYKARRQAIPANLLQEQSEAICTQAQQLIGSVNPEFVHLFLPIEKNNEVETWPLYEWLLKSEDITPVISKTDWKQKQMSHHPMKAGEALEVSKLGIPEPVHREEINAALLDLVFIPLLAFDAVGHRLGYGAGFYDRFLAQCPNALKVGLSLLPMTDELLPANEYDIALDHCITSEGIIDFKN